jgi:GMP synthase-like glutamine amidotransferase
VIGLLNAYRLSADAPQYQLDYEPMMLDFLDRNLGANPVRVYRVALGELPESVSECDGWIISGSPRGAYDQDPWIAQLGAFAQQCHRARARTVGICFGHQLIAHYNGGRVEKSAAGWGVGVHEFAITRSARWMRPSLSEGHLLFSHQDQVIELPEGAERLATSDFCPNQMFRVSDHVFCMQGHPEFTAAFARSRLESRRDIVGPGAFEQGMATIDRATEATQIGGWIRQFFE